MAGSRRQFYYNSDNGNAYRVQLDASNQAQLGASPAGANTGALPRNITMRYIVARHPATGARRRIPHTLKSNARWIGTTKTITLIDYTVTPPVAGLWDIVEWVGEVRTSHPSTDTGLTTG